MLPIAFIIVGYLALVGMFGWLGLACIAIQVVIMLGCTTKRGNAMQKKLKDGAIRWAILIAAAALSAAFTPPGSAMTAPVQPSTTSP